MYDRGTHGGTVYAGIGANLHIIFYNGYAYLWNLLVSFGRGCESESVSTDYTAGMQGTVVSYQTVVIDGGMWIKYTVVTYLGMASYGSVRVEGSVVTNLSAIAYTGKRSDIYILPQLRSRGNVCQRIYTGLFRFAHFIERQ